MIISFIEINDCASNRISDKQLQKNRITANVIPIVNESFILPLRNPMVSIPCFLIFNVSKTTIRRIVDPEKLEKDKLYYKERRKDRRYYDKENLDISDKLWSLG